MFVFVVEKLWVVIGVIFDVESESGIKISLSRQDFEIFEVMCSKNGVFRYFWGYVQGARNFFGFFSNIWLKFPFVRWRIEIYEIKRFRSLKNLTQGFRNCWLRKWGRKKDIFIYKMAGRFKMANWNLRGKQYWSLKFCTWEFFESLSTNACVQYANFFCVLRRSTFISQFTGLA